MEAWALFLLLNFRTPHERAELLVGGLTWHQCVERALVELKHRRVQPLALRCERADVRATLGG